MLRKRSALVALLAAFALIIAACGDDDDADTTTAATEATTTTEAATTTAAPTTTEAATTTTLPPPPPGKEVLACQVSDTGGIDDKSFNETAWKGAQDAEAQLEGVSIEFLESQAATDFRPNIDSFIAQGCDLITTVGFLLADDTGAAAKDNPDQLFAIIDFPVGPFAPWLIDEAAGTFTENVRGITFATEEAAFLAGYLAAGMTQTGVIGTFGGINIPPVTVFMDGFVWGADYYNSVHGTEVRVAGWDTEAQDGLFTGNFESLEDGRAFGQNLIDEGADIILPVAGPVGLGTAAVAAETGGVWIVGVDADWTLTNPENADITLTSILKNMDVAVFNTIQNVLVLDSVGNAFVGTLANGGVGLAGLASVVPAELADELAQLEADVASGALTVPPTVEEG
jgi:basic membrane protein A